MTKHYTDFYGGSASITITKCGVRLRAATAQGKRYHNKPYKTVRGARSAMSRISDGWKEVKAN